MKKLLMGAGILIITVALLVIGCEGNGVSKKTEENHQRHITDLAGNEVKIPKAEDINRVVIVAPPLLSTYMAVAKDSTKIVGVHPMAFDEMNPALLEKLIPNWKSINTKFLTGFTCNTEEVMKLKPDIIFVYGPEQKKGLDKIGIPVVDFFQKNFENEIWSASIDTLMRQIFETEKSNDDLTKEWGKVNEKVKNALVKNKDADKKRGLMVMMNTGDKITVRGTGSYGDDWLKKSGLTNVAADLKGDGVEVTMEQIYNWNPDIIYVFRGKPSKAYLNNQIEGQDWSTVKAIENKEIYDIPVGMFNWGAPNSDSPITLEWMVMKNYPNSILESEMKEDLKAYYLRQYKIELDEGLVDKILNPNQ